MAEKIEVQLLVDTKASQKNVENLNKDLKDTEADLSGIEDAGDKMTGGLISGFKGAKKGVTGMIAGLKTMKGAIIATGVGALVIAVTSLTAAFTSSEEGQNKLAKIMTVVGSITGNIIDLFAVLGNSIINVFTNPVESLTKFKDLFVENITNRISSAIETIGFLGSAIKKVFSGDFSGAMQDAKSAGSSYVDTLTGVKGTIDKVSSSVSNLTNELIEEAKIAGQIADDRAKADKLDRQLLIDRANANKERAKLLEQAVNKEKFSVEERIGFLKEAGALEEEITNKEIAAAKLRLDAKIAENALAGSTKADLEEEAQLKAQLINLETAKLTKQKEVTSQTIALYAEEAAAKKAIDDQKIADDKEAEDKKKAAADELKTLENQIRDAEAVSEADRRALEIEKVKEHYQNLIDLAKAKGIAIGGLEKALADKLAGFAEATSKTETKWSDMTQEEKLKLAKEGLNNMATILGEESAAGKAAAIASATISTFESAQSSYKSLAGIPIIGPVLGAAAAGAAIVSGMAQVKAITSTKLPTLAGKSAPSVSGGGISAPAQATPPSFNVVGQGETSQLADAIGSQASEPVRAYVVSNDVTTAQGLERNIVEGATI